MFVYRDKAGRIESVTGSIHQPTLDWLLAEDEWNQSGGKKAAPATRAPHPAKRQSPRESVKPEPAADSKDLKGSDN